MNGLVSLCAGLFCICGGVRIYVCICAYVHKRIDTVSGGGGFGGLAFWGSGFVPAVTNMYSCG